MKNAERLIVASVRRYAAGRGLGFITHGDDWILELELGRRSHLVHGYDLGLNTSSSQRVAHDSPCVSTRHCRSDKLGGREGIDCAIRAAIEG